MSKEQLVFFVLLLYILCTTGDDGNIYNTFVIFSRVNNIESKQNNSNKWQNEWTQSNGRRIKVILSRFWTYERAKKKKKIRSAMGVMGEEKRV